MVFLYHHSLTIFKTYSIQWPTVLTGWSDIYSVSIIEECTLILVTKRREIWNKKHHTYRPPCLLLCCCVRLPLPHSRWWPDSEGFLGDHPCPQLKESELKYHQVCDQNAQHALYVHKAGKLTGLYRKIRMAIVSTNTMSHSLWHDLIMVMMKAVLKFG